MWLFGHTAIFGGKRALEFSLGGYLEYEKWIRHDVILLSIM